MCCCLGLEYPPVVHMLRTRHLQLAALLGICGTFRRWTEWEEGKLDHQEFALKEIHRSGPQSLPLSFCFSSVTCCRYTTWLQILSSSASSSLAKTSETRSQRKSSVLVTNSVGCVVTQWRADIACISVYRSIYMGIDSGELI